MRIVLDRNRGGAYLTSTLVGAGLIGAFFFLCLYFQQVLGYSPVEAGLASLPTTLGVFIAAGAASALVPKIGPRPLMVARWAARRRRALHAVLRRGRHRSSGSCRFPGELLLGLGLGFTFVPLSNLALIGAGLHDAGAASAMLNATQQVGASIGTAVLASLSVAAISSYTADALAGGGPAGPGRRPDQAQVEGYTTAFTWAAGPAGARRARLGVPHQGDQGGPAGRGDAVVHVG